MLWKITGIGLQKITDTQIRKHFDLYVLNRTHYFLQPGKEARHLLKDITIVAVHPLRMAHYAGEKEHFTVQGEDGTARAAVAV